MQAYKNDPALKIAMLEEMRSHREQDQIIKGTYSRPNEEGMFRGCFVGCAIHSLNIRLGKSHPTNRHAILEDELEIPETIARLGDGIFEGLPDGVYQTWPERFLEAAPVGADLSQVGRRFLHWLLVDRDHGVIKVADERGKAAIQAVADLIAKKIAGVTVEEDDWQKAGDEATRPTWPAEAARAAEVTRIRVLQSEKLLELFRSALILQTSGNSGEVAK